MTTCVVVKKGNEIAIASDSLVTFGSTRLSRTYEANHKMFEVGGSWVALSGSTAHYHVLRKLLTDMGDACKLDTCEEIFDTFSRVHTILKEQFFLNTKEEDDDPYESSQIMALIANPCGIFGLYSYREVFSFDRFWSIGSGRNFALGAMYAAYDKCDTAYEIAEAGVKAGAEFDTHSAAPFRIMNFAMQSQSEAGQT